ncbi:CHAT domain-containing protein [Plantactinospora sp. DSM 117369]
MMGGTSTDEPGPDAPAPDPDPASELAELTRELADLRAELTAFDTDPEYRAYVLAQHRAGLRYEVARVCWQRYLSLANQPPREPAGPGGGTSGPECGAEEVAAALRTAMAALQEAREALPKESELALDVAWWLGGAWTDRYVTDADPTALNQVIELSAEVAGAEECAPELVGPARHRLGKALIERYGLAAAPTDLDRAVSELEVAAGRDPRDDPDAAVDWWYDARLAAGTARFERWRRTQRREDLDAAVDHLDGLAAEDSPDDPYLSAELLDGLARLHHDRAALLLAAGDRTAAAADVAAGRRWVYVALDRCAADDPARPGLLAARAMLGWTRYRYSGQVDDLTTAETELGEAIAELDAAAAERENLTTIRGMLVAERLTRGLPARPDDGTVLGEAYAGMRAEVDRTAAAESGPDGKPAEPLVLPPLPGQNAAPPSREESLRLLDRALDAWRALPVTAPERARFANMLLTVLPTGQDGLTQHPGTAELIAAARTAYPDDPQFRQRMLVLDGMHGMLAARPGDPGPLEDALTALTEARRTATGGTVNDLDMVLSGLRQLGAQLGDDLGGLTRAMAEHAEIADRADLTDRQRALLRLQDAAIRLMHGFQFRDWSEMDAAAAELRAGLAGVPAEDARRRALEPLLTLTDRWRRIATSESPDPRLLEEVAEQISTVTGTDVGPSDPTLDVYAMLARAGSAAAGYDAAALDRQITRLRERIDPMPAGDQSALTLRVLLAGLYMTRLEAWRSFDDAERAIELLERVRPYVADPAHPLWSASMSWLSRAYRARDDRGRDDRAASREAGLQALRGYAWRTLVQTGTAEAALAGRDALDDATEVFGWCVTDREPGQAVRALDACRGLVLQAASRSRDVPELLAAAGRSDLAAEWRSGAAGGVPIPARLRQRVMRALLDHEQSIGAGGRIELLDPPEPAEIAGALRSAGADALVYLVPATSERAPVVVVVPARGDPELTVLTMLGARFSALDDYLGTRLAGRRTTAGTRDAGPADPVDVTTAESEAADALRRLSDWAWYAAMEAVLRNCADRQFSRPYRLVLVPMGAFGLVPWHAARSPGGRYVLQDAVVSYAASARMFCGTVQREPVPIDTASLVVGNPTDDLAHAGAEATAIRNRFYPAAPYLGRPGEGAATGPGTPDEVLDWLGSALTADRGVLHLACHGAVVPDGPERSYLVLAGPGGRTPLTAERITDAAQRSAGGFRLGTVVLAACSSAVPGRVYDEAYSLATVFLMAGARSVVGSLWPVPDDATSLLMYMLHHYLAVDRQGPAQALRLAQLWMLDPDRRVPPGMPRALRERMPAIDPEDLVGWAGFNHFGQ